LGCVIGMALANSPSAVRGLIYPQSLPSKRPFRAAIYDWTGFLRRRSFRAMAMRSFGTRHQSDTAYRGVFLPPSPTGLIGGFQAGYNRQFSNRLVLGVEADSSFPSPIDVPRLGARSLQHVD